MPSRRKPSHAHRIPREFNLIVRLRTLALRRTWCWGALALALAVGRILLLPLLPVPEPSIPDEFSYLLAGDTFAHGRMANPTPAHPEFFESAQVLVRPAYNSKYPPGQGLILALGQRVFGHPYWGVVLSGAAMIFLFCWAADAWLPPQWALLAGALAEMLFFVRHYWFTSYWGGSLAACGGALVLGGLGHFLRFSSQAAAADSRPDPTPSSFAAKGLIGKLRPLRFSLAAGAAVLFFTRPYEGGVLCLGVLAVLGFHFLKLSSETRGLVLRHVILPSTVLLLLVASFSGWYNFRTTGSATRMSYVLHVQQYDEVPVLWILPPYGAKTYTNVNLRKAHEWETAVYNRERQLPWRTVLSMQFALLLAGAVWMQFLTFGLLLLGLPWARMRGRKQWLVFLLGLGVAALVPELFTLPHYTAPFTAAILIAIVASLRGLWYRIAASRLRGPVFVGALALFSTFLLMDYLGVLQAPRTTPRATLVKQLTAKGGQHLVLVDYADGWTPWASGDWANGEWVYNGADLASSGILFAHLRSDSENQQLFIAYPGRTAWVAHLGPNPSTVHLERYSPASSGDARARNQPPSSAGAGAATDHLTRN